MESEKILIVDKADVEFVHRVGAEHGVEVTRVGSKALEPVLTTTLMLFGAATAVATVASLIDHHRGGQVIDLRSGSPRPLYRSKDVMHGLVIIYAVDGSITVDVKEPAGMFGQVLESLTRLIGELSGAAMAEVVPVVMDRVGDAATITAEPQA